MSDSAVVELAKVINTCQPCVKELGTNCNDVAIVGIICATIVAIALIAKRAIWSWQKAELAYKENERNEKEVKEQKDCTRKQKADLLNKLLDFQKELAFPYDKNKDGEYKEKTYKTPEKENYLKTLASLLEIQLPE